MPTSFDSSVGSPSKYVRERSPFELRLAERRALELRVQEKGALELRALELGAVKPRALELRMFTDEHVDDSPKERPPPELWGIAFRPGFG